ncbi:MAG: hypothetical protein JWO05_3184 [Gemmatimonadetes bacterium]|nr:hypothetical protein [Gemmatimonadota bacterium]
MQLVELPSWSVVTPRRREHITRVTALLDEWARALEVTTTERTAWCDAGRLHDALRDAEEPQLRSLAGRDAGYTLEMLHGPAAAVKLAQEGEARASLLAAIRFHTVGNAAWDRTGRALYMADFLEPGRRFSVGDRAFLAAQVPLDFDGVFRQVVRMRMEHALREGHRLFHETVDLWDSVR